MKTMKSSSEHESTFSKTVVDRSPKYRTPRVVDLGRAEKLTRGEIVNGVLDGNSPTNPAHFKRR